MLEISLLDIESIRNFCLEKRGVTEELRFNEDSPVYKVMGKIFVIASLTPPYRINLKCDPEKAVALREEYSCVLPGWHMNKTMWNTVVLDGSVSKKLICEWIDHSYDEVVKKLPKKDKLLLGL